MKTKKHEQTTLAALTIALAVTAVWTLACGGGGSASMSTPTTPTSTSAGGSVTMNIVGITGSAAFNPNPVQVASGSALVWKNGTSVAHHIVMDDGTVVGDIASGASLTTQVSGSGGNFHCTIHPTMVGSINGAALPPDAMPTPSGGYTY